MTPETMEKVIDKDAEVGAHIYSRWLLRVYDFCVLGIVSSYAWCCSTKKVLLPFFRENIGQNHLDIGVGTGYYLANANVPKNVRVTLLDLNENSLDSARARFGREDAILVKHDVFKPLPTDEQYDSMSLFYLLHCLPGPLSRKTAIFSHLKRNLKPDGVLYGATILGKGVPYNWFARFIRRQGNKEGVFDNYDDNKEEIVAALEQHFEEVGAKVVGTILMFKSRRPKL
ncbi:hypothetical protein H2201_006905 [Coniosporium apollinis]|uniref:Methyltransferase type 12 domain-containing protein n=1 Tax=Coniosporium apollinis TaxID=61459 RepID=A0ABQ9NPP1_9PEZI|nr:hypothetical protein H2201_006905 [Coniosporium apollinis]